MCPDNFLHFDDVSFYFNTRDVSEASKKKSCTEFNVWSHMHIGDVIYWLKIRFNNKLPVVVLQYNS